MSLIRVGFPRAPGFYDDDRVVVEQRLPLGSRNTMDPPASFHVAVECSSFGVESRSGSLVPGPFGASGSSNRGVAARSSAGFMDLPSRRKPSLTDPPNLLNT